MKRIQFLYFVFLFFVVPFKIDAAGIGAGGSQSFIIDGNGILYVWGQSLGNQDHAQGILPQDSLRVEGVVTAAVSDEVAAFVDEKNNILVKIVNSNNSTDAQNTEYPEGFTLLTKPLTLLPTTTILKICLSRSFRLILDANGFVWASPNYSFSLEPSANSLDMIQVEELTEIKDIATGRYHALALDWNGQVFSWGFSEIVGLGKVHNEFPYIASPTLIPELSHIQCIAAGWIHSLAVDQDGGLWSFGKALSGALGFEVNRKIVHNTPIVKPQKVPFDAVLKKVAAGDQCSFAMSEDGEVWGWGDNQEGQLGLPEGEHFSNIQKLNLPGPVVDIASGKTHTLFLGENRDVWGCGSNLFWQLGDIDPHVCTPQIIPGLPAIPAAPSRQTKSANSRCAEDFSF